MFLICASSECCEIYYKSCFCFVFEGDPVNVWIREKEIASSIRGFSVFVVVLGSVPDSVGGAAQAIGSVCSLLFCGSV